MLVGANLPPNIKYERFFIWIIVEGLYANSGRSLPMDEGSLHVGVDFKYKRTKKKCMNAFFLTQVINFKQWPHIIFSRGPPYLSNGQNTSSNLTNVENNPSLHFQHNLYKVETPYN
jgi:hypothetical protein